MWDRGLGPGPGVCTVIALLSLRVQAQLLGVGEEGPSCLGWGTGAGWERTRDPEHSQHPQAGGMAAPRP